SLIASSAFRRKRDPQAHARRRLLGHDKALARDKAVEWRCELPWLTRSVVSDHHRYRQWIRNDGIAPACNGGRQASSSDGVTPETGDVHEVSGSTGGKRVSTEVASSWAEGDQAEVPESGVCGVK